MSVSDKIDAFLDKSFPAKETNVYRDLSLNFKKIMEESPLELTDRFMNLAALARALHWKELEMLAAIELKELGLEDAHIDECFEAAAIMGMLNTYYKFKGYLSADVLADSAYQRAGLRMNSLSKALNGKEKFEMMAFSVSVVNGCPTCVSSHEKVLTDIGLTRDKIHDLARLASVLKGLSCLS
ncbi:MAG: carboxymuconolactone decarboxylase family protein [Bdellovibrionaceae bacterium]|nr:carboxymuconolactone decarboxylase family protein [Bdellovibrio sp.]